VLRFLEDFSGRMMNRDPAMPIRVNDPSDSTLQQPGFSEAISSGGGVSRGVGRLNPKVVPFQVTLHGSALAFLQAEKTGNAVTDRNYNIRRDYLRGGI
jgi:hypothetical protein